MPGPGLDLVGDEELAEITDVIHSGCLSPNLAPFGLRARDSAEMACRQAERFIAAYREHVS